MDIQSLGLRSEEAVELPLNDDQVPPAPVQTPLSDKETAGFYRAMQEEREKRQSLEKQLAELKTVSEPPSAAERDLGLAIYTNNLKVSRRFAERDYGREVVSAVHDWAAARCDRDPVFNALMRASDDPYEAAKQSYDQEQARRTERAPQPSPAPPRSLADAPGNGAVGKLHVPVGDGNAYESLFK